VGVRPLAKGSAYQFSERLSARFVLVLFVRKVEIRKTSAPL
jgi:hypothetical protein